MRGPCPGVFLTERTATLAHGDIRYHFGPLENEANDATVAAAVNMCEFLRHLNSRPPQELPIDKNGV